MGHCPAGTQTNSKRLDRFPAGVGRLVQVDGYRAWDENGREFIDCISGLGAIVLGHHDWHVYSAAFTQLQHGVTFSLPTPLEEEVAELVCEIVPSADAVRFFKAGHEATMAAVRLARAYTGRDVTLVVEPGYHGSDDWYQALHESPGALSGHAVWVGRDDDPRYWYDNAAAVILEPVVASDPVLPRTGWLQAVREFCTATGTLLIFDEVVTFGRFPHLTAQAYFNVIPDLTCLGKCMGNGMPLSAVCGRADVMQLLEDRVFFSTTFGGEAVSLAAAKACLEKLVREDVGHVLWQRGQRFMGKLRELGLDVYGYPSRPVVRNGPEGLQAALIERGVLVGNPVYFSLTWCMTDDVLDRIVGICADALTACPSGR